jgi:alanyl-tRNA synthetase
MIEFTLDRTPFYAEGGGQVGDTGWVERADAPRIRLRVVDTVRDGDRIVHRAEVVEGAPTAGPYVATIDAGSRAATQRNHTATHLLHAALRERLGTHLKQAGSLVTPDRLRFDFTHGKALSTEEIGDIERAIQERIMENLPVVTELTSLAEAQAQGAMALFGEKYGDRVRQVIVGGYSRELCGGCHVTRTGEIGYLRIEAEQAVASGTRRLEAVTGALAYRRAEEDRTLLRDVAQRLGAPRNALGERVHALQEEARALRDAQIKQSKDALRDRVRDLAEEAKRTSTKLVIAEVEATSVEELREAGDVIRAELPDGGGLLAAVIDGKLSVAAAVGPGAVARLHADAWVRDAVSVAGGKGGGKKDAAIAGAKEAGKLPEVLERGRGYATERLAGERAAG